MRSRMNLHSIPELPVLRPAALDRQHPHKPSFSQASSSLSPHAISICHAWRSRARHRRSLSATRVLQPAWAEHKMVSCSVMISSAWAYTKWTQELMLLWQRHVQYVGQPNISTPTSDFLSIPSATTGSASPASIVSSPTDLQHVPYLGAVARYESIASENRRLRISAWSAK